MDTYTIFAVEHVQENMMQRHLQISQVCFMGLPTVIPPNSDCPLLLYEVKYISMRISELALHCTSHIGCPYSLDWTTGLDYWTGLLDWTTGLDYWTQNLPTKSRFLHS